MLVVPVTKNILGYSKRDSWVYNFFIFNVDEKKTEW
jgi:hypothetical protein